MLIEFNVANFRSFKDRQTLSLVKTQGNDLAESNAFQMDGLGRLSLLRSAVIYGPNASGKSNFLRALQTMEKIVLESVTGLQHGQGLPVVPFRLDQATRRQPSEFEVTFMADGVRYQYGFAVTFDRIHEEWLFAFPNGRPQRWFSRNWNESSEHYEWELGNKLAGEKQLWQKSTRSNALYLSTAVQLNSEQLKPVYDWFGKTLNTLNVSGWNPAFSAFMHDETPEGKKFLMKFMHAADLGIQGVDVERKQFDVADLPEEMPDQMKKKIERERMGKISLTIRMSHNDTEGRTEAFDFHDESDGTQKLFSLAGPWFACLEKGWILCVDELQDNLHPHLVRFLVRLFNDPEFNSKNAQLVFTTHETSMLDQKLLRRDQIWFCEKNKDHASCIYPLTDFSPRKGRENLERSYLTGRYGAVPNIPPLSMVS